MAFFRPDPNTEKRKLFNMAHFVVGFVCRILSVAAMFLGKRNLNPKPKQKCELQ